MKKSLSQNEFMEIVTVHVSWGKFGKLLDLNILRKFEVKLARIVLSYRPPDFEMTLDRRFYLCPFTQILESQPEVVRLSHIVLQREYLAELGRSGRQTQDWDDPAVADNRSPDI